MDKLKPCPFCGAKATYWRVWKNSDMYHSVHCNKCKAHVGDYKNQGRAIKAWNRRVNDETD